MDELLVNKEYLLHKFPDKGGWTYTIIPEVLPDKHAPFGWVKVKGSIDGYEIKNYNLQPTEKGDNRLFLAVKAEIRKAIKKEAGDYVHIILYRDNAPFEIPEELILCLKEEPNAYEKFQQLKASKQRAFVDWIYSAKTDETKVNRIATMINELLSL
jgi:Uncharacterized protein conserved in bacteria